MMSPKIQDFKTGLSENIEKITQNQDNELVMELLLLNNKSLVGELLVLEKSFEIGTYLCIRNTKK